MRRIALGLALGMFLGAASAAAQAQREPRLEIAAGYSFLRTRTVAPTGFNLNGGSLSVAANVNSWLGFVGDFAGYHTRNVPPSGFSLTISSYMFGPRISYRGRERVTIFAQELVGVGHAGGTLYTVGFAPGAAAPAPVNAFAMALGGGLDVNLSRSWAIRAFQTEWFQTTFPNGQGNRQHSFRFTTGISWRIGGR